MTRIVRRSVAVVVLALALALGLVGCAKPAEPAVQPKVTPPSIATAGQLTVGVDLSLPPFAGKDAGRTAGLDVDVAAALAEQLGLTVRYVDVKPSDAATALAQGSVDVVLSVPLSDTPLSTVALAGAYAADGPVFFISTDSTASVEPSLTLESLAAKPVGAQKGSAADWVLREQLDPDMVKSFDTLRAALQALDAGDVSVVAGDAFVGAYIARDFPGIQFAGQLQPASPLSVAVSAENTTLGEAVRSALDGLAADGVFDALRRKWVGDLPALAGASLEQTPTTP